MAKMNAVSRRSLRNIIFVVVIVAIAYHVAIRCQCIDMTKVEEEGANFHYNSISLSAIIGGFLFTGISILISVLDKERIKRLWDNGYLDTLYRASFLGMFCNILTIIFAIILIIGNICNGEKVLVYFEVFTEILGIVFFIWSIKKLISIVKKLKSE